MNRPPAKPRSAHNINRRAHRIKQGHEVQASVSIRRRLNRSEVKAEIGETEDIGNERELTWGWALQWMVLRLIVFALYAFTPFFYYIGVFFDAVCDPTC